ncbi:hypothetical protein O181_003771 [Austropuccinia psidii MF-1]|uniref:Secreted protein n=1 Tax=Austropuccinia psidii MF-1 TaxID=1389203 RepID=A0A9Q3BEA0_9BASI|nr:hypothetical protein [Austropuccinia psidii MF-1]
MLSVKALFYVISLSVLIGSLAAHQASHPQKHTACYKWKYTSSSEESTTQYGESKTVKKTKRPPIRAQAIMMTPNVRLHRRNIPTKKTMFLDSDEGICRRYNSSTDPVACLWDGTGTGKLDDDVTPGWLDGTYVANCNKTLSIRAHTRSRPVFADVADGCSFYKSTANVEQDAGCANIFVSEMIFKKLGGNTTKGKMDLASWDFAHNNPPW